MHKNKKYHGFTLIELIVVIAIIDLLALIATPKFIGYTEEARQAKILNDAKIAEQNAELYLLKHDKLPDDLPIKLITELEKARDEAKLYSTSGLVSPDEVFEGEFKVLEGSIKEELVVTNLKGIFYGNDNGKIYYEDIKTGKESAPIITIESYNTEPTNQNITVIASSDKGTLNQNSYTFTENGEFTFIVSYKDMEVTKTVIIDNIDKEAPALELSADTEKYEIDETVINVKASDNSGIKEIILPDGSKTTSTNIMFLAKENGLYEFKAVDRAGNETVKSIELNNILQGYKKIVTGHRFTMGIKTDGSLWAWGDNRYGQLGIGTFDDIELGVKINEPTRVNIDNVKDIHLGGYHTFAVKNDGSVWVWGQNTSGQLGLGDNENRLSPVKLEIDNVKTIKLGNVSSFIVLNDGSLLSFGANHYANLGLGDTENRNIPTEVDITNVKDVFPSSYGVFVLKEDNSLWVFGSNGDGALGLGETNTVYTPMKHPIQNVKNIFVGRVHGAIITNDNEVYMFGNNQFGQLGLGDNENRREPTLLNLEDVVDVKTCYSHTLFITKDGSVFGTGLNEQGQLGFNDNTYINSPTKLNTKEWSKISTGSHSHHTYIFNADGTITTFGWNINGQLGIPEYTSEIGNSQMLFNLK